MDEARQALKDVRKLLGLIENQVDFGRPDKAFNLYVNGVGSAYNGLEDEIRALGAALAGEVQKLALEAKRNRELGRTT